MPQLMPLMWLMSGLMIIFLLITFIMLYYKNFEIMELSNNKKLFMNNLELNFQW